MLDLSNIEWRLSVGSALWKKMQEEVRLDLFESAKIIFNKFIEERSIPGVQVATVLLSGSYLSAILHRVVNGKGEANIWLDINLDKMLQVAQQDIELDDLQLLIDVLGTEGTHLQLFPNHYPEWRLNLQWS